MNHPITLISYTVIGSSEIVLVLNGKCQRMPKCRADVARVLLSLGTLAKFHKLFVIASTVRVRDRVRVFWQKTEIGSLRLSRFWDMRHIL